MASQRTRDILLRIRGDTSDAERGLHDLAREVKDFGQLTEEAKVDLQTTAAEIKLKQLRINLDNLQKQPTSPKVDIAIGKTVAQIEVVEGRLDKLDRRRVDIDIDVDRGALGSVASGITNAFAVATAGVVGFASSASRSVPLIGGLMASLAELGVSAAALGPIFVGAAALAVAALATIGGALTALAASFTAAVAGAGVLAAGLAAAFGPVLLVGLAALGRFAKVMEAVNAEGEAREKLLKTLTPQERNLVGVLGGLKKALSDAISPATDAVFKGLVSALKDVAAFSKDPGVRRGLREVGSAIGGMLSSFGRELRRKETRDAFAAFARTGASAIRALAPVARSVFRLIRRAAEAALPWVLTVVRWIGRRIRDWADDVKKSDIERFVRRVRRSFEIWIGIVRELAGIVRAFFKGAVREGDGFAETLRLILRRIRIWLEQNPDKIQAFFSAVKWSADAVLTTVEAIADAVKWISDAWGKLNSIKGPSGIDFFKWLKPNLPLPGNIHHRQLGGLVPGVGSGDIVPAMLEPGEFVIRRSVAASIGMPRLNALNAGAPAALTGGGATHSYKIGKIEVTSPPGTIPDATVTAVKLAQILERRGGGNRN